MTHSLTEFTTKNPINEIIAKNMIHVPQLQEGFLSFEEKGYQCFSSAYEICRDMIKESPAPIWRIPDYFKKAAFPFPANNDSITVTKAVTISIVLILMEHFDEKWRIENEEFLTEMKESLNSLTLKDETIKIPGAEFISPFVEQMSVYVYKTLRRNTDIDFVIPYDEFEPQKQSPRIDKLETKVNVLEQTTKPASVETCESIIDELVDKSENEKNDLKGLSEHKTDKDKRIAELEADVSRLETQNEILTKQVERYKQQNGNSEWYVTDEEYKKIPEDTIFTRRQRLVFFATVLRIEFNKKRTIFENLATFIDKMCNEEKPGVIGPLLSKMQRESDRSANAKAAEKVANLMQLILPEEYRSNQQTTINQIIKSMKDNFKDLDDD